jgi:hypothetical protein
MLRRIIGGNKIEKLFYPSNGLNFRGDGVDVKLSVDGEEIDLNEFVVKILSGAIVGAVTSLRGIKKDWKEIEIRVKK